jgi:hypothetical protein
MGFWDWANEPATVELASRIVTARARDLVTVRGKLIVHFREPQKQAAADAAADACAELAARIMRDAPNHVELIGGETTVISELVARLPPDLPLPRTVELHSLHVVGSSASSPAMRRPSSGAIAAVRPPGAGGVAIAPSTPGQELGARTTPAGATRIPSNPPGERAGERAADRVRDWATVSPIPGIPVVDVGRSAPPRRISSTRMRVPTTVSVPPGATAPQIGAAIVPLVRDSAARILIGILRAHDLVVLRKVQLDDSAAEVAGALVPTSEAPPGGFEASRGHELARWQGALGTDVYRQLCAEAALFSIYLAYAAMIHARVPSELTLAAVEATCASGYPPHDSPLPYLGRYLHAEAPRVADELANRMIGILGDGAQSAAMTRAIAPLLEAVREEIGYAAIVIRNATAAG